MSLRFDPISSPDATRDHFVDFTGALEQDEVLSLATIVSGYSSVLTVSNVAINSAEVALDSHVVAIGKGVHLTVTTNAESQAAVPLVVAIEGNSGTRDKYEIIQPIVTSLSE